MNMPDVNKKQVNVGVNLLLFAKIRKVAALDGTNISDVARRSLEKDFSLVELDDKDMEWVAAERNRNKERRKGGNGKRTKKNLALLYKLL